MPPKKSSKQPEVQTPIKHGTFGPESGPYGETEISLEDSPLADASESAAETAAEKKAQAKAENVKSAREVKVVATRRGYAGNRIIEEGTVFVLNLEKGQEFPSWVKPTDAGAATTPLNHSAEAQSQPIE